MSAAHFQTMTGETACGQEGPSSENTADTTCGACLSGPDWNYEAEHDETSEITAQQVANAITYQTGAPAVVAAAAVTVTAADYGYTASPWTYPEGLDIMQRVESFLS